MSTSNSLWTPREGYMPEMPVLENGQIDMPEATLVAAQDVRSQYEPNENVYRANVAKMEDDEGVKIGGNCFARAEDMAEVLNGWRVEDNYIVLNDHLRGHASILTADGDTPLRFDSWGPLSVFAAAGVSLGELASETAFEDAHKKFLQDARSIEALEGSLFWLNHDRKVETAPVFDTIATPLDITRVLTGMHVILRAQRGIRMLHAIGDLTRYSSDEYVQKNGVKKFEQMRAELYPLVPAFITIHEPDASLAGV